MHAVHLHSNLAPKRLSSLGRVFEVGLQMDEIRRVITNVSRATIRKQITNKYNSLNKYNSFQDDLKALRCYRSEY